MKTLKIILIILTTLTIIGIFHSCSKEDMTDGSENKFDETLFSKFIGGVISLSKEEYEKLPVLDVANLNPIPGFETELRSSSRTLNTPIVGNQGSEGSCTAWAIGYCALSYYNVAYNGILQNSNIAYTSSNIMSPEYLYNNTKYQSACNSGALIYKVLDFIKLKGVTSWQLMPYSSTNGCSQLYPNGYAPKQIFNPKTGKMSTFYPSFPLNKINNWGTVKGSILFSIKDNIRNLLFTGRPVIAALDLDENFYTQTLHSPYTYTSNGGILNGSHCVTIIGYDDDTQKFKVQNSWGINVQDKGYFYVPYNNVQVFKELYSFN